MGWRRTREDGGGMGDPYWCWGRKLLLGCCFKRRKLVFGYCLGSQHATEKEVSTLVVLVLGSERYGVL